MVTARSTAVPDLSPAFRTHRLAGHIRPTRHSASRRRSGSAGLPGQSQGGYQSAVSKHPDRACVLDVDRYRDLAGIGDAEKDADDAVVAGKSRYLAGVAIDDHALDATSPL